MHLLIVRHAVAQDRDEFAASGQDDSERPLIKDGRKKMRLAARGLAAVAPAVDEQGRVYTADPAAGMVRVLDPAEGGGPPRPVLMQLAAPSAVAVDSVRGRLLVAERDAARLRVYELP